MRRFRATIAIASAALLVVAAAAPAAAADPGKAYGWVKWKGEDGTTAPRTSRFSVVDGTPGLDSDVGDGGWFYLSQKATAEFPDKAGTLRLDVSCVRLQDGWAEFAGVQTSATGVYVPDADADPNPPVWRVYVVDTRKDGYDYQIAMGAKHPTLAKACKIATDGTEYPQTKAKGVVSRGYIRVKD